MKLDSLENRRAMLKVDCSKCVSPKESGDVIMFLVSKDSSPTSGAVIPVCWEFLKNQGMEI